MIIKYHKFSIVSTVLRVSRVAAFIEQQAPMRFATGAAFVSHITVSHTQIYLYKQLKTICAEMLITQSLKVEKISCLLF